MLKKLLLFGLITFSSSIFAMLPAQPRVVQVAPYADAKDLAMKQELQCLNQSAKSAINMLHKSRKLKNEPMNMQARSELREQKKLCIEFKDTTRSQKARRTAIKQIARMNNALAGIYRKSAARVNLVDTLEKA